MKSVWIKASFLILILGNITQVLAQSGTTLKNQIFKSDTLKNSVEYNVYLPPNYNKKKIYPVIYYLHGFGGNNNSSAEFFNNIDSLIIIKKFPEAIIFAPNGKNTWYINDYAGKNKYSSMFTHEFLPYLKKIYPITHEKNKTAIMGISMGGFGALRFTMLNPNDFGICISFMAGISTKAQVVVDELYTTFHDNLYGNKLLGDARVNNFFLDNNPLYIAQKLNPSILKNINWFIQSCDNDYHSLPNAELHCFFHKLQIEHEFRISDGEHDNDCVNNSMKDALNFLNKILTK